MIFLPFTLLSSLKVLVFENTLSDIIQVCFFNLNAIEIRFLDL